MDRLHLHFDLVDVVVAEPDAEARRGILDGLQDTGFENVRFARTRRELRRLLDASMPDLLISETRFPDGELCGLVHEVRHHHVGTNPFVPVIAVSGNPTPDTLRRVIGCGADALLAKPVSAARLVERITALIDARRPFVVTSDYIGPDRRRDPARKGHGPLTAVPNTLKARATGEKETAGDIQPAIDAAIAEVNLSKVERHAAEIVRLVDDIVPGLESGAIDVTVQGVLSRLLYVAEDSSRRAAGTRYDHLSDLCRSLVKVIGAIRGAGKCPDARDVGLLKPLSRTIEVGFGTGTAVPAGDSPVPAATK